MWLLLFLEKRRVSDHDKFMAAQHLSNGGLLEKFMPIDQRFTLKEQLKSEEGAGVAQAVLKTVHRILATPLTYQTDHIHMPEKTVHLHYCRGGMSLFIPLSEKHPPMSKKLLALAVLTALAVPAFACHNEPIMQRVWLRYDTYNPDKPPILLTENPGVSGRYTDFAVTIERRRSDGEPIPQSGYVSPWNVWPTRPQH